MGDVMAPTDAELLAAVTARINDIRSDLCAAEHDAEVAEGERDEARADAARWKAEADRYREALAFYADERNWLNARELRGFPGFHGNATARAALSAGGGTDA